MRGSLRGFCFQKKEAPLFLKAWFACARRPPGFILWRKRHLIFYKHGFPVRGALRGVIFWKKDPPKLSQHLPGAPRADPDLYSLPVPPELSPHVFSTSVGTSQAKPYFLRAFWEVCFPKMVSKVYVLDEAVMKKSKKHNARATSCSFLLACASILAKMEFIRGSRGSTGSSGIPIIRWQEPRLGPSLPRAPGARMT